MALRAGIQADLYVAAKFFNFLRVGLLAFAKDQQGLQEAEVRKIRHMLENAEIIQSEDDGVAGPGKLVTIKRSGEEPETYVLGIREEKRAEHDVLTPESPLGQAIIGHSAGETVTASVPAGELRIEIVEVKAL